PSRPGYRSRYGLYMCLHAAGCYSAKRFGVLDWFGNDEADDSNRHLDEHGRCHCGHYRCINARASYLWLNLQHRIARGAIEKDRNIMNSLPLEDSPLSLSSKRSRHPSLPVSWRTWEHE